jgi:hypothetical protein
VVDIKETCPGFNAQNGAVPRRFLNDANLQSSVARMQQQLPMLRSVVDLPNDIDDQVWLVESCANGECRACFRRLSRH